MRKQWESRRESKNEDCRDGRRNWGEWESGGHWNKQDTKKRRAKRKRVRWEWEAWSSRADFESDIESAAGTFLDEEN